MDRSPFLQVSRFVDPRDACSAIAAESYKLWLEHENRTDDITIIVVQIKDMVAVSSTFCYLILGEFPLNNNF